MTELPDSPCFIKADLSQFVTALINMAVNARDAMDSAELEDVITAVEGVTDEEANQERKAI